MGKWLLACGLAVAAAGCTEEQLRPIDAAVADVNAVGQMVAELPDSPVGAMLPPWAQTGAALIGAGTAAAVALWERSRKILLQAQNQRLQLTGKAIVTGIERSPTKAAEEVKANISGEMDRLNIRDTGRQTVKELKGA